MDTAEQDRTSLLTLIRLFTGDIRTFVRQEIQLAKTELSEKVSHMARNAALLAVGGFIAYAGLIVFLIGLSWLIAWFFEMAGLQPVVSGFLGLGIIGLLVITTGVLLLFKGLSTLKKSSLSPHRTIKTLQELKGGESAQTPDILPKPSSAEIQARVEATEDRMGQTLDELGRRLSPEHIQAEVTHHIQVNPYRSGFIAMGAGLLSGLFLRIKLRRAT